MCTANPLPQSGNLKHERSANTQHYAGVGNLNLLSVDTVTQIIPCKNVKLKPN